MINGHSEIRDLVLKNCNNHLGSITVDRFPGAINWIKDLVAKEEANNE